MTAGLLCSTRKKNELSMKIKRHPSNNALIKYYKTYRNKLNTLIKETKIHFYKNKFNSVSHNPKATWKLINEVVGNKAINKDNIQCLKIDNKIIDVNNELIKAYNVFNEYFNTIGSQLSKKFIKSHQIELHCPYDKNFDTIFIKSVDKNEVITLINNLKDEMATGFDKITVKLLKSISRFITNPIIFIYNKSL